MCVVTTKQEKGGPETEEISTCAREGRRDLAGRDDSLATHDTILVIQHL